MDALPPSLPNAGLPQPATAATAGLAILLAELTEALAKLPASSAVTALVTQILPAPVSVQPGPPSAGSPPTGILVQISTPDGPAQIRLPPQIPVSPGTRLDIAVAQDGPQPQWRLLAVNDRPVAQAGVLAPASPSAAPAANTAPTIALSAAATAQIGSKAPPSSGISAILVTSSDPALPSGTTLMVRIIALTPAPQQPVLVSPAAAEAPADEPPETSTPKGPGTAAPTTTAAPGPPPTSAAPAPAPVPATALQAAAPEPITTEAPAPTGTPPISAPPAAPPAGPQAQAQPPPPAALPAPPSSSAPPSGPPVRLPPLPFPPAPDSALTAAAAPSQPAAPPPPAEVSGQVLANTDGGRPLVRTPIGLLALDSDPRALPADSGVTLQMIGKPVPPLAVIPTVLPDDPPERAVPRYLAQVIETAQAAGDDALAQAVRDRIPSAGPKLAAQLLSAIAAAAQPDAPSLTRFLGDGLVSALTHAAPQLAEALSRHWESAAPAVQGPGEGDWRTLMIPFLLNDQTSTIRLTVRQRQGKMTTAEREKGTRFLLDLDLSRLGPMQFDGLVKRQHKRFDLIIRTLAPLAGEMRRDIDALFVNGLLNFGLEGSVSFRPDGRFVATPRQAGNGIIFA